MHFARYYSTISPTRGKLKTTATFDSARTTALGGSGGTFDVVNPGTILPMSGLIGGPAGALTKTGTGTLELTNPDNAYGGGTVEERTARI
jgi:fibronectin-binding autotransporter adhesin